MKAALTILTFLLAIAFASAATPTREEVLEAVKQIEAKPVDAASSGPGKVVRTFGNDSKEAVMRCTVKTMPWLLENWNLEVNREKKVKTILFTAYAAGNIKSQLTAPKPEDDFLAGWTLALQTYKELKSKDAFSSPALETLLKQQAEGTLNQRAETLKKELPPLTK